MVNISAWRQRFISSTGKGNNKKFLLMLILAVPASVILDLVNGDSLFLFIFSCISVIPLAKILGDATEVISSYTGPKIGGLLNATMGNIPELFIGIFSVRLGLFSLVKASIVGSITGNMLLVLGFSILFGGIKYKFQSFDKLIARTNFGLLFLALIGFIIPVSYNYLGNNSRNGLVYLSLGIAIVLLTIYLLGLFFSLYTHKNVFIKHENDNCKEESKWGVKKSVLYLILATAALAYEAQVLVSTVESIRTIYNIPEVFLGIVIIPIIGNIAEYTSAILMALKNRINLSIEIAIGSSMQMALFVVPFLIIMSFFMGNPMTYVFSLFELVTIACAIGLSLYIFQDGKTNWLEGVELLSAYIIMGLAFFLMG